MVRKRIRSIPIFLLCMVLFCISIVTSGCSDQQASSEQTNEERVKQIVDGMSMDDKVSQMIMPAIRVWDNEEENVTDLSKYPELTEALRKHKYCGIILFGQNFVDSKQSTTLINDLQVNNAKISGSVPYFIAADQEGGAVARLNMGTRGTGSMAIGATGENGANNAKATGKMFGEELSALGVNVNLGPCVDVIQNLADMGMSTRVFSDTPEITSKLSTAYKEGVDQSNVITTFKHFPGVGDGSDFPTSIKVTLDELKATGLTAYENVINSGAQMLMVSATTYPLIDDTHLMADGETTGYYPATMSSKIVTGLLRNELGYDGVVITDALDMDQFITEPDNGLKYFPEEATSVEHGLKVAKEAINAGCDILLMPTKNFNKDTSANYYDNYINGIIKYVESGEISQIRIDESVTRILSLKAEKGILDLDVTGNDLASKIENAEKVVGSTEHHATEAAIAEEAVTLLKDDNVLPVSGKDNKIVIIGRTESDNTSITYALDQLIKEGYIDPQARIENNITGENKGDESSSATIVIDKYFNSDTKKLEYSDELSEAVSEADHVILLSAVGAGIENIQDEDPCMQGIARALSEAQESGAKFILLSNSLPVDAVRFQDSDAIVCSYLAAGVKIDPLAGVGESSNPGAYNANIPAAIKAIFGAANMSGTMPVNVYDLEKDSEGNRVYNNNILYERGYSAAK